VPNPSAALAGELVGATVLGVLGQRHTRLRWAATAIAVTSAAMAAAVAGVGVIFALRS
jgi:hypothetical protein